MPLRLIRDVIAKRKLVAAPSKATVLDAARLMKAEHVGAILVVDEGRLAGIFTERDVLFRVVAEGRDPKSTRLASVMSRKLRTIPADRPVGHALHMMYEGGFRHVPVVEGKHPIGMISARDALGPELSEFEAQLADREHIGEILG